jgi:hypothetical protein
MRINYKDPNIYYIAVPILAGLWAVLAGFVFYPNSTKAWDKNRQDYEAIEKQIKQLAALQPKRLEYKIDEKAKPEAFDFFKTVNDFAKIFGIADSNYNINVRPPSKRAGKQARSATILIKRIDIEKFAQFLSGLLLRWPSLKCEQLSIEKVKNTKNNWKVDLSLTYYYE